jgi:transglutaminase-like putative cysteine protease
MAVFEAFLEDPVEDAGLYLFPVAPDTWEQKITGVTFEGREPQAIVKDVQGRIAAYQFALKAGDQPMVKIAFDEPGPGLSDEAFMPGLSAFERPSQALMDQIAEEVAEAPLQIRVPALIQYVGDHFTYGARETHLGTGEDAMPALECGLTPGTCVDMHTLAVAALRAVGVPAAYVIGVHIAEPREQWSTGHCWLNLKCEGVSHHWDISHHVQYGVREITPKLNPKPGRRFALSIGRGPEFSGPDGVVSYPSLSGFHGLTGPSTGQKLRTLARILN